MTDLPLLPFLAIVCAVLVGGTMLLNFIFDDGYEDDDK